MRMFLIQFLIEIVCCGYRFMHLDKAIIHIHIKMVLSVSIWKLSISIHRIRLDLRKGFDQSMIYLGLWVITGPIKKENQLNSCEKNILNWFNAKKKCFIMMKKVYKERTSLQSINGFLLKWIKIGIGKKFKIGTGI